MILVLKKRVLPAFLALLLATACASAPTGTPTGAPTPAATPTDGSVAAYTESGTAFEGAATYYISDADGDDGNAGTSPEAPWKTLGMTFGKKLQPGDRILLKRGDTFTAGTKLSQRLVVGSPGTAERPVVVGAYGVGPRPVIRGSSTYQSVCVMVANASHVRITDLEVGHARLGVYFRFDKAGSENLSVDNCRFTDFNDGDIGHDGPDGWSEVNAFMASVNHEYAFSTAIFLGGRVPAELEKETLVTGWRVTDCTFARCDQAIANGWWYPPHYGARVRDVHFSNLVIDELIMSGIGIFATQGGLYENIHIRGGSRDHFVFPGLSGFFFYGCSDVTIRRCSMVDIVRRGTTDAPGIDFEYCRDMLLEKTLIGRMDGQAVILLDTSPGSNAGLPVSGHNTGIHIRDCVFFDNLRQPLSVPGVENLSFDLFSRNARNSGILERVTVYRGGSDGVFSPRWELFERIEFQEKPMSEFPGEAAIREQLLGDPEAGT